MSVATDNSQQEVKQFKLSRHLLQLLERLALLEHVRKRLRPLGANAVACNAATESGITMLSVAIDKSQIRK